MLWLILLWSTILCTTFLAGLTLGSALCNQRWTEKCARCQALLDRLHTTPGTTLHYRRGH